MKGKIFLVTLILATLINTDAFSKSEKGGAKYDAIIMFPGAPNPCAEKCLVRVYLPENDPFATIRILNTDSTLIREVPLSSETGIGSAFLNVSEMQEGNYLYQLFYKGEPRQTLAFTVKH